MDAAPAKTILFLAASPKETSRRQLDEEVRQIGDQLQRARKRDQFALHQRWSIRANDLPKAMLDVEPQIVHFSGHGAGVGGLGVEDEVGNVQLIPTTALANLFKLCKSHVECVLLNACYSEIQAEAISQHIPYVIGMSQAIGDRAAIQFAIGFYAALGAGRSYEDAYEFGCNAIEIANLPEELTPKIKKQPRTAPPASPYRTAPPSIPPSTPPPASPSDHRAGRSSPRSAPPQPPTPSGWRSNSNSTRSHSATPRHSGSPGKTRVAPDVPSNRIPSLSSGYWLALLATMAVWTAIGYWTSTTLRTGFVSNGTLVLLKDGAIGGLLSGLISSIAGGLVDRSHWERMLMRLIVAMLVGMVAGAIVWCSLGSILFVPMSNGGHLIGFGVGLAAATFVGWLNWQRSSSSNG
jgi:hypothetical protein